MQRACPPFAKYHSPNIHAGVYSRKCREVAHAYYFLALADSHPDVKAAYDAAVASGIYKKVRHVDGSEKPAYALENELEYFSELSEAYFGKNDFFPFTRDELEKHDPRGFKALKQAWGI